MSHNKIFGRVHRLSVLAQALAMEAEDTSGKAGVEIERELYVRVSDLTQLERAVSKERQEQWGIKVPKTKRNAAPGQLRVRRSEKDGKVEFIMTIKAVKGVGERRDVSMKVTEDVFDLFRTVSENGMIKDRFTFPVLGTDLVYEVDMFVMPDGSYAPWAKIDLENPPAKLPPLPIMVEEMIDGKTSDPNEREKISQIYGEFFLTPNPSVPVDASENSMVAIESIVDDFKSLFKRGPKKLSEEELAEQYSVLNLAKVKLIKRLKETFANDEWLQSQKPRGGPIAMSSKLQWLQVNGQIPKDTMSDTLAFIDSVTQLSRKSLAEADAVDRRLADFRARAQKLHTQKEADAWMQQVGSFVNESPKTDYILKKFYGKPYANPKITPGLMDPALYDVVLVDLLDLKQPLTPIPISEMKSVADAVINGLESVIAVSKLFSSSKAFIAASRQEELQREEELKKIFATGFFGKSDAEVYDVYILHHWRSTFRPTRACTNYLEYILYNLLAHVQWLNSSIK